jgi:dTDP-4-amino-4,6-dideoxygalactose transaminase
MSKPEIKYDLQIRFGTVYGKEEERAVLDVLRAGAPTSAEKCVEFEKDFAAYTGSKYARVVSNGTAALFLPMVALGVGPGDTVLTTPLTWIATAAVAATLGAKVDFVDIDPETFNIDPGKLEAKLKKARVKALLPVHLYGQCCEMDEILALSKQYGFAVVEDACHAPGAEYKGKKAGTFGVAGAFSFHEQKNISTLGGGMIVTDDPAVYEKICLYRSHCARVYGKSTKYCSIDEERFPMGKRFWFQDFDDCGYNYRLTDIQAAVGIEQLKKLDEFNRIRAENAAYLTEALIGIPGITTPAVRPYNKHVFHLYPILIDPAVYGMGKEDFVYRMLHEKGIKVGTHYGPLHLTQAFQKRGFKEGDFPVTEGVTDRLVTLPINPRQTREALDYMVKSIGELSAR